MRARHVYCQATDAVLDTMRKPFPSSFYAIVVCLSRHSLQGRTSHMLLRQSVLPVLRQILLLSTSLLFFHVFIFTKTQPYTFCLSGSSIPWLVRHSAPCIRHPNPSEFLHIPAFHPSRICPQQSCHVRAIP